MGSLQRREGGWYFNDAFRGGLFGRDAEEAEVSAGMIRGNKKGGPRNLKRGKAGGGGGGNFM